MKKYRDKIDDFNKNNFSEILYEFGITPNEVKQLIIEQFHEYFQNQDNLQRHAINDLTAVWYSFLTIQRDFKDTLKNIEIILNIYNSAKVTNTKLTFDAYAKWFPDFSQSITRFWSIYYGQKRYDDLCDEDYLYEILQLIGQSIEGVAKPFLQFTLYLNRLKRGKSTDRDEIKNKDLGVIIDELISTSDLKDSLIINNIRLNQWRNISYHHNTKIVNDKMFFYIKKNGIIDEFETTREELKSTAKIILNLFKIIRISETIFFVDNFDEIKEYIKKSDTSQFNFRKESELLNLNYSISTQGFSVSNLEYDENYAILDVTDLETYSDVTKKAIHSSQFLYNLWLLTESKHLKVNYYLSDGTKFLTSEIISSDFKNNNPIIPFHELMRKVQFTYINTDVKQNIDPFENLNFPKELINNSPQFYSQKGDKITLEEFSKQFTKSIFCNYLALKAEGFNDIKINIGSDGALVITEKPATLVLKVPAVIRNEAFQLSLIELLNKTIQLYESKLLTIDIVNEAKNNNDYYRKIAVIKDKKNNTK